MNKELIVLLGVIILLFLFLKLFKIKWKLVISLIVNAVVGGIVLYFVNYIPGVNLDINVINSIIVGLLGVPGVILLLVLYFIK